MTSLLQHCSLGPLETVLKMHLIIESDVSYKSNAPTSNLKTNAEGRNRLFCWLQGVRVTSRRSKEGVLYCTESTCDRFDTFLLSLPQSVHVIRLLPKLLEKSPETLSDWYYVKVKTLRACVTDTVCTAVCLYNSTVTIAKRHLFAKKR